MADIAEIAKQLEDQLKTFEPTLKTIDVGEVLEVGDGIARASGLENVESSELVEFENGVLGIAFNLEEDEVGIIIMGDYVDIQEGGQVTVTGRIASVPVGEALIGRVVDPLGNPVDGKGPIATEDFLF